MSAEFDVSSQPRGRTTPASTIVDEHPSAGDIKEGDIKESDLTEGDIKAEDSAGSDNSPKDGWDYDSRNPRNWSTSKKWITVSAVRTTK
jgi:hypothetical protein